MDIEEIVGQELVAVEFVQDFVRLRFEGPVFTLYAWPFVLLPDFSVGYGEPEYRNALCAQIGQNVQVGQELLSIVPLKDIWITANFKETQLERMVPGQSVEIRVDALGGLKLRGRVTSIAGATGARFSLLPPENATGNYVKVVQRVPVRIDFVDRDQPNFNQDARLRPGLSVLPNVRVR